MNTEQSTPDIVNLAAFKGGYAAFFKGSRKPYALSPKQQAEVAKLKSGKRTAALVKWYEERGIILTLTTAQPLYKAEQVTLAECPYKPHTYAAKEWQRGFNAAYFNNIERNRTHASHSRTYANHGARPIHRSHKPSTR